MADGTVLGALRDVHVYLSDPAHWTRGCSARDAMGRPVLSNDEAAVCHCLTGAIGFKIDWRDGNGAVLHQAMRDLREATRRLYGAFEAEYIGTYFNDVLDYSAVMRVLDAAIETLQVREAARQAFDAGATPVPRAVLDREAEEAG